MQSKSKTTTQSERKPIKRWGCWENHLLKDCPHRNSKGIHHISEAKTVEYMARAIPRINASLDNRQANHQSAVVEMSRSIRNLFQF